MAEKAPERKSSRGVSSVFEPVIATSLEERGERFMRLLKKTQDDPSEKLVHDLRVAARRLMATLDIVDSITADTHLDLIRNRLRRWLRVSNPLRDTQVQVLLVRELLPAYPILEPFLTVLLLREKMVVKRILRTVKKGALAGVQEDVNALSAQLWVLCQHPVARKAVEAGVSGAAGRAFARATERFLVIDRNRTVTIHRFRLSFKKLRYTMEALQLLLQGIPEQQLEAMNEYQQRMGDIQDLEVLRSMIDAYAVRRGMTRNPDFSAVQAELMSRRVALVDRFMSVAGDFYRFWPGEFTVVSARPSVLKIAGAP